MALFEKESGPDNTQYQEPDISSIKYEPTYGYTPNGMRLRGFVGMFVELEPVQDNIRRYPPVQVGVPRNPSFISDYVTMKPTNWSEVKFTPVPKNED